MTGPPPCPSVKSVLWGGDLLAAGRGEAEGNVLVLLHLGSEAYVHLVLRRLPFHLELFVQLATVVEFCGGDVRLVGGRGNTQGR